MDLKVGEKVEVLGTVSENFGMTVLQNVTEVTVLGTGTITPVELDPSLFSDYSLADNEQYEGMLVRFSNPGGVVHVVEVNADGPTSNFGEWRLGNNPATPQTGSRILTGRQTSSIISSLNVSYINDPVWEGESGQLQVPAVVVTTDSSFQSVTGLMAYSNRQMKLIPRNNADFVLPGETTSLAERPAFLRSARLMPNPVQQEASLEVSLTTTTRLSVQLFAADGRWLREVSAEQLRTPGDHHLPLAQLNSLAPGLYFLRLASPGEHFTLRMIKQ